MEVIMAFVKLTKAEKNDMFRKGGYRERSIMRNSKCAPTTSKGMKNCVTFHSKDDKTATYYRGGKHGAPRWIG